MEMKKIILMSLALMSVNTILCDDATRKLAKKYNISGNFWRNCKSAKYEKKQYILKAVCQNSNQDTTSMIKILTNSNIQNNYGTLTDSNNKSNKAIFSIPGNFGQSCNNISYDQNTTELTAICLQQGFSYSAGDSFLNEKKSTIKILDNSNIQNNNGTLTDTHNKNNTAFNEVDVLVN